MILRVIPTFLSYYSFQTRVTNVRVQRRQASPTLAEHIKDKVLASDRKLP